MSKVETIKARQSKLKQALLEQLRRLPVREIAYDKAGVTRMTVSRWRKASKKFADEMDAAMNEGIEHVNDLSESQLISLIRQGKFEPIRFWLQNKHKGYGNKLELSGTVGTQEVPMTKAEKAQRLQALKHSSLSYGQEKKRK